MPKALASFPASPGSPLSFLLSEQWPPLLAVTRAGNDHVASEKEKEQSGAQSLSPLSSGPRRLWGLKRRIETHVLYHKILGTLHLQCKPENTRHGSVYEIPGLCSLIPVYKNNSPAGWDHGEMCGAIWHGPSWCWLTFGGLRFGSCCFGKEKKSKDGSGAGGEGERERRRWMSFSWQKRSQLIKEYREKEHNINVCWALTRCQRKFMFCLI